MPFVSSTTGAVAKALRNSGILESGSIETINCTSASPRVEVRLRDESDERTLVLAKEAMEQAFRRDGIIPQNSVLDSIWHTTPLNRLAIMYLESVPNSGAAQRD